MPNAFERHVLLFHVQPITAPKGAPIAKLKDLMQMVHEEWEAGRAITRLEELEAEDIDQEKLTAAMKRPNNAVYIQDMELGSDGCDILLTLGDAAEADPTIVNLRNKKLTQVKKGTNGGVGFSAHLSFSFKGSAKPTQYRAALERMPGLGRTTAINYLNRVLRNHSKGNDAFRFVEDGTGRDLSYRPKLTSASQPARGLTTALKTGRFSEVVLVQRNAVPDELDSAAGFKVKEKRLKVSVEDVPATDNGRREWLNMLTSWARSHSYNEVQVRFKAFGGGQPMSSKFSTELTDAAEAIFSRHEQINFTMETGQCHDQIVDRIRDPLSQMVAKDSLWK